MKGNDRGSAGKTTKVGWFNHKQRSFISRKKTSLFPLHPMINLMLRLVLYSAILVPVTGVGGMKYVLD